MKRTYAGLCLGLLVGLNACGDDEKKPEAKCDYAAQTGCKDGLVCEQVSGNPATTGCFAPVTVAGRVVRADDPTQGIEGARVIGRDENGESISLSAAIS